MYRFPLLAAFVIGVALPGLAFGQETAEEVVEKVRERSGTVRFAGVRTVWMRTAQGERRFEERILRQGTRWKISYPEDSPYAGQAVWEMGGKRYQYTAATDEVRVTPSRAAEMLVAGLTPRRGGSVKVSPGGRVAGRDTVMLEVAESDGDVRQRAWVDRSEWVVLKRELFDGRGKSVGGFEFRRIEFGVRLPRGTFDLPRGAQVLTVMDVLEREARAAGMTAHVLDARSGWTLVSAGRLEVEGMTILRQFYTSERGRVSLFQMRGEAPRLAGSGGRRVRTHQWKSGGFTFALVGEMSEQDLRDLARRVRAKG